jgi:hypothetical protein
LELSAPKETRTFPTYIIMIGDERPVSLESLVPGIPGTGNPWYRESLVPGIPGIGNSWYWELLVLGTVDISNTCFSRVHVSEWLVAGSGILGQVVLSPASGSALFPLDSTIFPGNTTFLTYPEPIRRWDPFPNTMRRVAFAPMLIGTGLSKISEG